MVGMNKEGGNVQGQRIYFDLRKRGPDNPGKNVFLC
jgi:hypothetical protein